MAHFLSPQILSQPAHSHCANRKRHPWGSWADELEKGADETKQDKCHRARDYKKLCVAGGMGEGVYVEDCLGNFLIESGI